jgi:hypothetical protein
MIKDPEAEARKEVLATSEAAVHQRPASGEKGFMALDVACSAGDTDVARMIWRKVDALTLPGQHRLLRALGS